MLDAFYKEYLYWVSLSIMVLLVSMQDALYQESNTYIIVWAMPVV